MGWIIFKTILSLGAILGLMAGCVVLIRKFFYGARRGASSTIEVKVLGYTMLQPKRAVYVLQVLNKLIVVGNTEEGLRTLAEIDDEASLMQAASMGAEQTQKLGRLIPRNGKAIRSTGSFADSFSEQLASLKPKRKGNLPGSSGGRNNS